MANSKHDDNGRPTIICASSTNGTDIVPVYANSTRLNVEDGVGGSDNGNNGGNAMIDDNSIAVWTAISSSGDGSIIEVYANPTTKAVLIKST